ncbi:hypothetical protein K8R66_03245 [bacterium]|nr:hypothetical protein [bacterium]
MKNPLLTKKQVDELFKIIKNSSIWKYLIISYSWDGITDDKVEAFSFKNDIWTLSQTFIPRNATFGDLKGVSTTNKEILKITYDTEEEAIESFMELFRIGEAVSLQLFPLKKGPLFIWQTQ